MSNTSKAVGGFSILGFLGILFHLLHSAFGIYEYNHKTDVHNSIEMSIKNLQQLQQDMDSIRENVKDTILRDSLIQERARKEMDKIGSSIN